MAKKNTRSSKPKTIRRTSTMVNAVAEGQRFLAETKKKRATRTRTMAETIKEGQSIIARKTRKPVKKDDQRSESIQADDKDKGKKQKKITKSRISRKATTKNGKDGKASKQSRQPKKDSTKSPSKPSSSVPVTAPANIKKTIFKTKSKDHLPIPAFGFIDVCFCIDATGSMGSELAQAQSTILSIINNVENKVRTQGLTLRFAVVSYRDHAPQESTYVTQALDFTDGHEAGEYVKKLQAWGGGDFPEAVHDGLMHCCKNLNWVELPGTPTLRYIFHIADAPPHGKQFGNTLEPREGCLCGMKTQEVYHEINIRQIHYRLIKARANSQLNTMEQLFKKGIVDFNSVDLSHAKQMDVKVSDMIIHEVVPQN